MPANCRQSSAIEEKARDLLLDFLESLDRSPLQIFVASMFQGVVPPALSKPSLLWLEKEVEANCDSRADLVISADNTVLCVEVKVDAAEQLGQYIKYRDYFRSQGKTVYVAGLINRFKGSAVRNNNEPFFESLRIPRVLWSELLTKFEEAFGSTREFGQFSTNLRRLHAGIGAHERLSMRDSKREQSCDLLAKDNAVLREFYQELLTRFPGWEGVPNKYGNAPYELHLGKKQWAELFQERGCRRIVIGLNQPREGKLHNEPYFAPGIMLWNRTWFSNQSWFLDHRQIICGHFRNLGFQVVRNAGSTWHRNEDWLPPFEEIRRLKYANAFWERRFSLKESEYCQLGWHKTLTLIQEEIAGLAEKIDALKGKIA